MIVRTIRDTMTGRLVSLVVAVIWTTHPQAALASDVTFTRVVSTDDGFTSFRNPFSVNDNGEVVFVGFLADGITEIRVGDGGPTRLVADTRGEFESFLGAVPVINDKGSTVYRAKSLDGVSAIHLATVEGNDTILAETSSVVKSLRYGRLNNSDVLAFWATMLDTENNELYDELRKGDMTGSVAVANTLGRFDSLHGFGINEAGLISFAASLDEGGEEVWLGNENFSRLVYSPPAERSVSLTHSAGSLNIANNVPILIDNSPGTDELRIGNGEGPTHLVAAGGPFSAGGLAINDSNVVAFSDGGDSLFTSLDLNQPLVAVGDELDGDIVSNVSFAGALSDSHHVAFRVMFVDNGEAVYVASLPGPPALASPLGDMDFDSDQDFDDINPFLTGLFNEADYEATFGLPPEFRGDVNLDGNHDFDDIGPFIEILNAPPLTGVQRVAEPRALELSMIALLAIGATFHLMKSGTQEEGRKS